MLVIGNHASKVLHLKYTHSCHYTGSMICIELDNACGTTCQMMIYDAMTARGVVDESIFCVKVYYIMWSLSLAAKWNRVALL